MRYYYFLEWELNWWIDAFIFSIHTSTHIHNTPNLVTHVKIDIILFYPPKSPYILESGYPQTYTHKQFYIDWCWEMYYVLLFLHIVIVVIHIYLRDVAVFRENCSLSQVELCINKPRLLTRNELSSVRFFLICTIYIGTHNNIPLYII